MKYIINYLFNHKITECYQKNSVSLEQLINNKKNYEITECSNITECYQITNKCCKNINNFRQYQTTNEKTIVVGLELPNKQGKLIRFIPRDVTIITKQR